jgi:hypothetical protein
MEYTSHHRYHTHASAEAKNIQKVQGRSGETAKENRQP